MWAHIDIFWHKKYWTENTQNLNLNIVTYSFKNLLLTCRRPSNFFNAQRERFKMLTKSEEMKWNHKQRRPITRKGSKSLLRESLCRLLSSANLFSISVWLMKVLHSRPSQFSDEETERKENKIHHQLTLTGIPWHRSSCCRHHREMGDPLAKSLNKFKWN